MYICELEGFNAIIVAIFVILEALYDSLYGKTKTINQTSVLLEVVN